MKHKQGAGRREEGEQGSRNAREEGKQAMEQQEGGGWGAEGKAWGTQGQAKETSRGPRGTQQRQAKGDTYKNLPGHRQCPPAHHPVSRLAAAGATGKRMMLAQVRCGTNKQRKGNETGNGLVLPTAARRAGRRARKWQNPAERMPHSTASQQRPSPKEPLR